MRVDELMAVLAFVVAGMYAVIAFTVIPQLGRAHRDEPRLLGMARWGAMAFFAGCALTHLGMGVNALQAAGSDPGVVSGLGDYSGPAGASTVRMVLQGIVPHLAQIIGGGVFIAIALVSCDSL